jgi:hypothetical protein
LNLPASVQDQFTSSVGGSAKNTALKAYSIKDTPEKIKTFYQAEFTKAGWIDATAAAASQLEPINSLGGWALAYAKVPNIAVIILLPSALAGAELGTEASPDTSILLVVTGTN